MISKEEFRNACIESIKQVKDVEEVDIANDEDFSNAGLDSLDSMDLVLQVESQTGLDFGELDPAEVNTIDKFYAKAQELFGDRRLSGHPYEPGPRVNRSAPGHVDASDTATVLARPMHRSTTTTSTKRTAAGSGPINIAMQLVNASMIKYAAVCFMTTAASSSCSCLSDRAQFRTVCRLGRHAQAISGQRRLSGHGPVFPCVVTLAYIYGEPVSAPQAWEQSLFPWAYSFF